MPHLQKGERCCPVNQSSLSFGSADKGIEGCDKELNFILGVWTDFKQEIDTVSTFLYKKSWRYETDK